MEKRLLAVERRREYLGSNNLRLERSREEVAHVNDLWEHLEVEERRGLLQALVEDIVVPD